MTIVETPGAGLGEIVRLAWPIVSQQLLRTLAFAGATAVVGQLGPAGTAAMGIAMQISLTTSALLTALSVAAVATVARACGGEDRAALEEEVAGALLFGGMLGVVLTPLGVALLPEAAGLYRLGDTPEVEAMVRGYLAFEGAALGLSALDAATTGVLRGLGRPGLSLGAAAAGLALQGLLWWLLVVGAPSPMGIRGAGVASLAAMGLQTALGLALLRGRFPLGLAVFRRVGARTLRRLGMLVAPAVVEPLLLRGGHLAFLKAISLLGAVELAAHQAALSLESFTSLAGLGFGAATSALVGQQLGARRPDDAERTIRLTVRFSVGVLVAVALGMFVAAGPLTSLFLRTDADPVVARIVAVCLGFVVIEQPFMVTAMVFAGALRGAGDTRTPVWAALAGMWIVRIPLTWFLVFGLEFGLTGAWAAMVSDWMFRVVIFRVVLARGRWREGAL